MSVLQLRLVVTVAWFFKKSRPRRQCFIGRRVLKGGRIACREWQPMWLPYNVAGDTPAATAQSELLRRNEMNRIETGGAVTPRKKFPWIIYWILLFLIVVVALSPIGSIVVAGWIASSHGCRLDEGSAHPCVINGKDYGETLYTLGVLGWFMLVTIPAGAIAFLVWLVVLLLHRKAWGKKRMTNDDLKLLDGERGKGSTASGATK
jgi:hypothetical protein